MRALLDTHTVLWFAADDRQLSRAVKQILEDDGNELYFSSVSAVEISIKWGLGKLDLEMPPREFVNHILHSMKLRPLPLSLEHGVGVSELPRHHSDPFDRLLIAQAMLEDLPIVTADRSIRRYDVKVIW